MFKYLLALSVVICLSACTDPKDPAQSTSTNAATTSNTTTDASGSTPPAQPAKTHFKADHETPFCKLWVAKFVAQVDDRTPYDGRWFDLKKDGTFETGQYQETTNFGQWSIEKETDIIKLLFNNPETLPPNWKVQGSGGGGRILWKGNVPGNLKGIQMMMESDMVKPNK